MLAYSIHRPITNVVVFGCGGTGSRAVPNLAQLLTSHDFTKNVRLICVDGDNVEEKNCKRQLFIKNEVGSNKAEVIARRYRLGFGARTEAVPFFVPSVDEQMKFVTGMRAPSEMNRVSEMTRDFFMSFIQCFLPAGFDMSALRSHEDFEDHVRKNSAIKDVIFGNTSVMVMCVDSVEARMRILTLIQTLGMVLGTKNRESLSNMIVIDAGNEDVFGQVTYFNPVISTLCPFPNLVKEVPDRLPYTTALKYVPFPIGRYLNLREDQKVERSCADMDQTLAINCLMAVMITMIFQNLLYGQEMDYHTVYCNLNGSFYTEKMSPQWMKGVMSTDKNYLRGAIESILEKEVTEEDTDFTKEVNRHNKDSVLSMLSMHFGLNVENSGDTNAVQFLESMGNSSNAHTVVIPGVGSRSFVRFPQAISVDIIDRISTIPNGGLAGEKLHLWKYTNYAYTNWANLLYPVLFRGLQTKFLPITKTLKEHAVMMTAMTYGPAINTGGVDYEIYMSNSMDSSCTFHKTKQGDRFWYISRVDLPQFGRYDMSNDSYRDLLPKSIFEDGLVEGSKVVLPRMGNKLIAGSDLRFLSHQTGTQFAGSPFLIINEAILLTMPPVELKAIWNSLYQQYAEREQGSARRSTIVAMKSKEALQMSVKDLVPGDGVRKGDRGAISIADGGRFFHVEKGMSMIFDQEGNMFGTPHREAPYNISAFGRVIPKETLANTTKVSLETFAKALYA